jgi:hypothetical protein
MVRRLSFGSNDGEVTVVAVPSERLRRPYPCDAGTNDDDLP